jgi:hypothetical protein
MNFSFLNLWAFSLFNNVIMKKIPDFYKHLDFKHSRINFEKKFSFIFSVSRQEDVKFKRTLHLWKEYYNSAEMWIGHKEYINFDFDEVIYHLSSSEGGEIFFDQCLNWILPNGQKGKSVFFKSFSISFLKHSHYVDVTLSCFIDLFSNDVLTWGEEKFDIRPVANVNRRVFNDMLGSIYKELSPFRVELSSEFGGDYVLICGMELDSTS